MARLRREGEARCLGSAPRRRDANNGLRRRLERRRAHVPRSSRPGARLRVDRTGGSGRHAAPALSRRSLGSRPVQVRRQQRPPLEEPPAVRSALRPGRARLRDLLRARGNSRQTRRPVRARPRLRLPRPPISDPAVRADAHARPGVEAVVAAFGALRDGRAAAGAGLRRAGRARARGSGHALLQSGAARPEAGIAGAAPGTPRRVRDRDRDGSSSFSVAAGIRWASSRR